MVSASTKSPKSKPKQADDAKDEHNELKRQAVVIVHGQGEQRPMGTLRDFIDVLWTKNPDAHPANAEQYIDGNGERSFWVVPDCKAGLYELQRVTTPVDEDGRRTDFFELYYADLLNNTPAKNLWRWLRRLFWIEPADLPRHVRWPWSLFMLLAIVASIMALTVVLSVQEILSTNWLAELIKPETRNWFWVIVGAGLIWTIPKLIRGLAIFEKIPASLLGIIALFAQGMIFREQLVVLSIDFLLILMYLASRFLLPYFGDAASYLSAQTETVGNREEVRARGLNLLRSLHDDPSYDRVIIVAHSLGTVLAYDLLHILWGEVGPTKDNPPSKAATKALKAVDAFVATRRGVDWSVRDVDQYQDLQWAAHKALTVDDGALKASWKISDFVALGSPLASAQFLITEGAADFKLMKEQRVLPTAPAQPYSGIAESLYHHEETSRDVSHHGAVFSAVRWSNIYDDFHPVMFLIGDPIAGPVGGDQAFGKGVADYDVTIRHNSLFPRFFTHNFYWQETSSDWQTPAEHIKILRAAIGLSRK